MVIACMETGNTAKAREQIAELEDTFPVEVAAVRHDVLKQYGIHL